MNYPDISISTTIYPSERGDKVNLAGEIFFGLSRFVRVSSEYKDLHLVNSASFMITTEEAEGIIEELQNAIHALRATN